MKSTQRGLACLLAAVVAIAIAISPATGAEAATSAIGRSAVVLTTSPGTDIFQSGDDGQLYSYGASIILNPDGSADQWNCTPGANGAWDYIRYRHSPGGTFWGASTIVLTPTPGSQDELSACDPSVVKIGAYHYLAYTSLNDPSGGHNGLFVARATSPSGPFDKWNGTNWGGNPVAFLPFTPNNGYGIGEPSLVVVGTTLFVYYSYYDGTNDQTRVATADASSANWPGTLSASQVAIPRAAQGDFRAEPNAPLEDSTDVKYVDSLGLFVAVGVGDRWTFDSYITQYFSSDGVHFTRGYVIDNGPTERINNIGLSGDASGHLDTSKANFVIYAAPQNSNAIPGAEFYRYIAKQRQTPISLAVKPSGAANEVFAGAATQWTPQVGAWTASGGTYRQTTTGTAAYSSFNSFVMDGGTYRTSIKLNSAPSGDSFAGIGFDRPSSTSAFNKGYVVLLTASGQVKLVKSAVGSRPDTVVATASTGTAPTVSAVSLRIHKSDTTIRVYVGGAVTPAIDYADDYLPFTGGGVALISHLASAEFGATELTNNSVEDFANSTSWTAVNGTWSASAGSYSQTATGPVLRRSLLTGTVQTDTNYLFSAKIDAYSDPNGFIGVQFDQTTPSDDVTASGYMVFLRSSGNIGIYKAGYGVVTEVPSGTNPNATAVPIRVSTFHVNINGYNGSLVQVYVGSSPVPKINWRDDSSPDLRGGYLSLVTNAVSGRFANFSLDTQFRS